MDRFETESLRDVLVVECGYAEYEADAMIQKLCAIDASLRPALRAWIDDRSVADVHVAGASLQHYVDLGISFPGALLLLDLLQREAGAGKAHS